jgi:hypothetical protein
MFRVFQMFHRYVSSVFSRSMLQLCLSEHCICFTHMLYVFYLDVAYGCNGFQVCFRCFSSNVSKACYKCFNCFHTYAATSVFGCFKRSGVTSLFLSPSVASSLPEPARHPYDATIGSLRIGGVARLSPLVTRTMRARCIVKRAQCCTTRQGLAEGGVARGGLQRERA